MNQELNETIEDFNETLMDLAKNISILAPQSVVSDNIDRINNFVMNLSGENKKKLIDLFISNVYSNFKKIIYERDDSFFLNRPKNELINKLKESSGDKLNGYDTYLDKIFDLKDIWVKLSKNNQDVIFDYLIILCELSENYIELEYPELVQK